MDVDTLFTPWPRTVDPRGKGWSTAFAAALCAVALTAGLVGCTKGKIPESESRQVLLEAANSAGESPWMSSVATATVAGDLPAELSAELSEHRPAPSSNQAATADAPVTVSGDEVGLYGGSTGVAVCDREKMVTFLERNPAHGDAWRQATGTRDIRKYANTLSPVLLTNDTRVTNNNFKNGAAVPFQSVLQAGTGVMVDDRGVPRVRCACGNPLSEPQSSVQKSTYTGNRWENFSGRVFAVREAVKPMAVIELSAPPVNGATEPPPQGAKIIPGQEVATESELPNPLTTTDTPDLTPDTSASGSATPTTTAPVPDTDTTTTTPTTTSSETTEELVPETESSVVEPATDEDVSTPEDPESPPSDIVPGTAITTTTLTPISEP